MHFIRSPKSYRTNHQGKENADTKGMKLQVFKPHDLSEICAQQFSRKFLSIPTESQSCSLAYVFQTRWLFLWLMNFTQMQSKTKPVAGAQRVSSIWKASLESLQVVQQPVWRSVSDLKMRARVWTQKVQLQVLEETWWKRAAGNPHRSSILKLPKTGSVLQLLQAGKGCNCLPHTSSTQQISEVTRKQQKSQFPNLKCSNPRFRHTNNSLVACAVCFISRMINPILNSPQSQVLWVPSPK